MSQLGGRQQGKQRSRDGSHLLLSKVSCRSSRHIGPGATQQDGVRSRHKDPEQASHTAGPAEPRPLSLGGCSSCISPSEYQSAVSTTRRTEL